MLFLMFVLVFAFWVLVLLLGLHGNALVLTVIRIASLAADFMDEDFIDVKIAIVPGNKEIQVDLGLLAFCHGLKIRTGEEFVLPKPCNSFLVDSDELSPKDLKEIRKIISERLDQ